MYIYTKEIHGILGVLILFSYLILVSLIVIYFFINRKIYKLKKLSKYVMILSHIQLILGLLVYFFSPIVENFLENPSMEIKNKDIRFFSLEHPLMMSLYTLIITLINLSINRKKVTLTMVYVIISIFIMIFMFPFNRFI